MKNEEEAIGGKLCGGLAGEKERDRPPDDRSRIF
jgi:hypothetical protein